MRRLLLTLILGVITTVSMAQTEERFFLSGGDTIRYTYTPLAIDSTQLYMSQRKGFLGRVVDYFGRSAEDRTFEKKMDITFAGGPSYSKTTQFGIGALAAGLYRLDRTDSVTPPSNISIFGNVSTSGFYALGVTGNIIFRHSQRKVVYDAVFSSAPRDVWGIGYAAGRYNPKSDFVEKRYALKLRYLERVLPNTYVGALLQFEHTDGCKFDELSLAYIEGQKEHYTSTGIGAILEYDSRDFIPNPSRGIYVGVQGIWYAEGLGNCEKDLWRSSVTANFYQRLWPSGLVAFDFYGEFNAEGTPWPMLARMGGNQRMRGYYLGQYTDNNMLTCQVELRQHIWRRIGCVVWGGAGNVFSKEEPFRWRHTLPNYGLGLRWELKKRVNVRMDYGFGRNTSGFLLSIDEAF